jgi:hypothetical protein
MPKKSTPEVSKPRLLNYNVKDETTEEELWEAMRTAYRYLMEDADEYIEKARQVLEELIEHNPYSDFSRNDWRRDTTADGKPTIPRTHKEPMHWVEQMGDFKKKKFYKYKWLYRDFELCDQQFRWFEKYGDFNSMRWDCEKFKITCDDLSEQITDHERMRYIEAWEDYKRRDADFINYNSDAHTHTLHTPMYMKHYRNEGAEILATCRFCIKEREFETQKKEDAEEFHRLEKERDDAMMRRWAEEDDAGEELVCDDCEFVTRSKDHFNLHMKSARHALNELRCKPCNFQARSDKELSIHQQTTKHKKLTGEQENVNKVFSCACCEYTTPYKHVYNLHMISQKHMKKQSGSA